MKFKLNIDEESLLKFYERINHYSIHESHDENKSPSHVLPIEHLFTCAFTFKEMIDAVQGDTAHPHMLAEIVHPFVLRGLLILLLNPYLIDNEDQTIMATLMNSMETLLATNE